MYAQKPLLFFVGNALMALSFFVLVFIYFPVIQLYFFPGTIQSIDASDSFAINIPKIHLIASVIPRVDPFDEIMYKDALTRGIAHAKGSALPGERGTVYLFGHSSDSPWNMTRYNTIFLRIGELEKGDIITLQREKRFYHYVVHHKKTVWPTDVSYVTEKRDDVLILQTCTPIGTDFQRLLIFATPQE